MRSVVFCISGLTVWGQLLDELPVDKEFHQQRRAALRAQMPDRSVAVFFAAPVRRRSNTVMYPYQQQRDFFYLTGFKEPHTLLLVFKEPWYDSLSKRSYDELLLTQATDARAELYDGRRLRPKQVPDELGIAYAYESDALETLEIPWEDLRILLPPLPQPTTELRHPYPLAQLMQTLAQRLRESNSLAQTDPPIGQKIDTEPPPNVPALQHLSQDNIDTQHLERILTTLRERKTKEEQMWLTQAINVSCQAQYEVMRTIRPGISEREVQGIHEFIYKKYGIAHTGYPSIVGAGHNGCVLHYIENNRGSLSADELILMDLGAEYNGYTADITRTIPVGGRFNSEQRAIYDLVYAAQEAVLDHCRPGARFADNTPIALRRIHAGLTKLGILPSDAPLSAATRYAPHGVTHHIGLDVHDGGQYTMMQPHMIFTVEPGIYIPPGSPCAKKWWNIAVRIEDNIMITDTGYELLSGHLPRTSTAIEQAMAEPKTVLHGYSLPKIEPQLRTNGE